MILTWIVFLSLLATTAAAQESPPDATFRTGTELVQVSVVAQDKNGEAVADLHREDFQIFDNGAAQKTAIFLAAKPAPEPEVVALPGGVFTNQIATDARTGYSVLLFDNLNVGSYQDAVAYTARARHAALRAMNAIPPGDRIAIYSLWCQFQVIREFTSDRDSLLHQLDAFVPAPGACVDPSSISGPGRISASEIMRTGPTRADGSPGVATMTMPPPLPSGGHGEDGAASAAGSILAAIADQEMKQIVEHLAGIPGRKNLVWLATTFRISPANLQRLINANVTIYPVDTLGSTIALASAKQARAAPINALAAITGGKAYFDRDDLDVAIGDALNDGRLSYTLGFYRPEADRKAAVHRIEVRSSREGVVLRYRTSYSVEAPKPKEANPVQMLVDALDRPVNATAIAVTASPTRSGNKLDLALTVDVSALDLQQKNGFWVGQAELVVRFRKIDTKIAGKVIALTLTLHLRPTTYVQALQRGLQLRREIEIPTKAVELNLLVGNLASGKIGTLTIPLSEVRSGTAAEKSLGTTP